MISLKAHIQGATSRPRLTTGQTTRRPALGTAVENFFSQKRASAPSGKEVPWGYGAGMTPDTHVRLLMQGVVEGKHFSHVGFPGRVSICAVEDIVESFVMALERDDMVREIYFVSDGATLALRDLFRRSGSVVGRRAGSIAVPRPITSIARRLRRFLPLQLQNLNSDVLCVSNAKLSSLGFRPKVPQRQGFANLGQDIGALPKTDRKLLSVVTGAASGIGLALASAMQREGHRLLLIDRNEPALAEVGHRLGADWLALDLTQADAVGTIERYIENGPWQLDWVVNCAGIGVRGAFGDREASREDDVLALNIMGLASLSRLALKHFRAAGRGTLINIGSSAGFQPLPFMATYSASKAFVQNFTRAVASEISDVPGIVVLLANPSGSATGFQQAADVKVNPREELMPAPVVAERIIEAAYARRSEVTIGRRGQAMSLMARILPMRLQLRLWRRLMGALR